MDLIVCNKETFLNPLTTVSGIVERKTPLPILANVLISKQGREVALTTSDMEIQIKTKFEVEDDASTMHTTVNAKKLQDILKSLSEEQAIKTSLTDNKLLVQSGKTKFNLQVMPATDYPEINRNLSVLKEISISQKKLKELLNKTYYAMAIQDIRYYLNGMLLIVHNQQLSVVATDGHRLAYANTESEVDFGEKIEIILPRKTVLEMQRLLQDSDELVHIKISTNQISFDFNQIELTSKLVEGKFPDYQKVIPSNYENTVEIDRAVFQQALHRVSILSNEKFRGVRCLVAENQIKISSTNIDQENAQEEIDVDYAAQSMDIGFNVAYLLDVLNNQKTETIQLNLGEEAGKSVLITNGVDPSFKYVVMPMRI